MRKSTDVEEPAVSIGRYLTGCLVGDVRHFWRDVWDAAVDFCPGPTKQAGCLGCLLSSVLQGLVWLLIGVLICLPIGLVIVAIGAICRIAG